MVGANIFHHEEVPGLDNLCAFLYAVCQNHDTEEALAKYDIKPPKICLKSRNSEILALRLQGLTYQAIGERYGLTKHAAFKVCKKAGAIG